MYTYKHKVQYYETDKMGITHHSNYIRCMEEARVAWMENMGWSYKKCEDLGMISPTLAVNCQYKKNTTFNDVISINIKLKQYNGLRLKIEYTMLKENEFVAFGETEHCFTNSHGLPIRIKKDYPEFNTILIHELDNT